MKKFIYISGTCQNKKYVYFSSDESFIMKFPLLEFGNYSFIVQLIFTRNDVSEKPWRYYR